ncbi:AMP-binding protein [Kineococcus sp. SYSU DK018]|uniref:AMP-binding protein n=1 Tax=Kineococcus sp. SYSU DK018 TaxID=3383139 RepID=UPI003D7C6987
MSSAPATAHPTALPTAQPTAPEPTGPADLCALVLGAGPGVDGPAGAATVGAVPVRRADLAGPAERWSHRLGAAGVRPGEVVGVLARKDPETLAAVLACWRLGASALLTPTALPPELLADVLGRGGCRLLVDAPAGTATALAPAAGAPPAPDPDTALVLTTSGSTGRPKLVPLPAGSVARFATWAAQRFGLAPGTRVLSLAPLNFDLSLLEVWAALAAGAEVVLADPEVVARGRSLLRVLQEHSPHLVQAVPVFLDPLVRAAPEAVSLPGTRHVLLTGDVVGSDTLRGVLRLFPSASVVNVYGSTETNDSFLHEVVRGDATGDPPGPHPLPIGRPLPGVEALLLDADGHPVPGAGEGELVVRTPFQSRCYLDPAATAQRFTVLGTTIPAQPGPGHDPATAAGRTWFRTGDLVRRREDGTVELVGRLDHQVKVRGTAVNLAEVERVLGTHPGVRAAAVATEPCPAGGRRLVAVVQVAPGPGDPAAPGDLELRRHCTTLLHRAAVPTRLHLTGAPLPTTTTGKVDRTAALRELRAEGTVIP